jgi:dolichol kinase
MSIISQNNTVSGLSIFHVAANLRTELIRKSIHFLIALAPSIAAMDRSFAVFLLASGTLFYAFAESARAAGFAVPFVSSLTVAASRDRDKGRFVLGPVTLGLGAMLAMLLYPNPAASIAVYALAFGDGFASIVGKLFGRTRPAFLLGKSVEGSAACFIAVFVAAYRVAGDFRIAVFAAFTATLTEALPLEDYDNIVLPMVVGGAVELMILF